MPTFGQWTYTVDREATLKAYALAALGAEAPCSCANCRNFRALGLEPFPKEFLSLLDSLGIPPLGYAEVVEYTLQRNGLHLYGGWFHFVGRLEMSGDFPAVDFGPAFNASLSSEWAPQILKSDRSELVQLHFFSSTIPWRLEEPDTSPVLD